MVGTEIDLSQELVAGTRLMKNLRSPADVDVDSRSIAGVIHGDEETTDEGTVY